MYVYVSVLFKCDHTLSFTARGGAAVNSQATHAPAGPLQPTRRARRPRQPGERGGRRPRRADRHFFFFSPSIYIPHIMSLPSKEKLAKQLPLVPFETPPPPFRHDGLGKLYEPRRGHYAPPSSTIGSSAHASLLSLPRELFLMIARTDVKTCGLLRMSGFFIRETSNDRKQYGYELRRRLRAAALLGKPIPMFAYGADIRNAVKKMIYAYVHLPSRRCIDLFESYDLKDSPWSERATCLVSEEIAFHGLAREADPITCSSHSRVNKLVQCAVAMRIAPSVCKRQIVLRILRGIPYVLLGRTEYLGITAHRTQFGITHICHKIFLETHDRLSVTEINFPRIVERFGPFYVIDASGSLHLVQ